MSTDDAAARHLDGAVAIVTGAGGGLGRAHALRLARDGAAVVVNDLGTALDGSGRDAGRAQAVVDDIVAMGGRAVASGHDVADWTDAGELVALAVEHFGDLNVLVANAGIIRDRTFANMQEAEWDDVVRVVLKGDAAPSHHAVAHWKDRAKSGDPTWGSVIHTSSISGLFGSFGQANYAAAKLAVLALSRVISMECAGYGVRSNAIVPSARTRMTEGDLAPAPDGAFDRDDPANVSAVVSWLADPRCPADAQVIQVYGERLMVSSLPPVVQTLMTDGRWTQGELWERLAPALPQPVDVERYWEWFSMSASLE